MVCLESPHNWVGFHPHPIYSSWVRKGQQNKSSNAKGANLACSQQDTGELDPRQQQKSHPRISMGLVFLKPWNVGTKWGEKPTICPTKGWVLFVNPGDTFHNMKCLAVFQPLFRLENDPRGPRLQQHPVGAGTGLVNGCFWFPWKVVGGI